MLGARRESVMAMRFFHFVLLAWAIGCADDSGGAEGGGASNGTGGAGATSDGGVGGATGGTGATATGGTGAGAGTAGSGGSAGSTGGSAGTGTVTPTEAELVTIPSNLPGCNVPFPHDPAVDEATGLVYYADSNVSCIGEFNPDTGQFRAWPTPTPGSYPHGLVVDDQSRVFYTGQNTDRIGRLIPSSGMLEDFSVAANGPHTPIFHQGRIWFTAQQGGQYGHFDRESGASQVYPFLDTQSRPYGIAAAPDGSLWVALFARNRIARIDTSGATPSVEEFTLPNTESRPRRIAVDDSGRVWYTDYNRSMLGMLDPAAAEANRFDEFPMPAGGQPYGIAIGPDGRVWVDDEDTPEIAGFDPDTKTFIAQLPIPIASAGPVRNMAVDRARKRIWLAISNIGRLGLLQF
jgi:virginiamycin B lyase